MSQPDASHRPRRDLFQPAALGAAVAAAADVVADLRQALTSPESAEPEPDASPLLRFSRSAMATLFEVLLPLGTPRAHAAAQSALDVIDAVEDELSIYRPTSALSDLNRRACAEAVTVSPGLFAFLEQAARLHEQTGGAFDLAAGALVAAWGFFRGPARWPDAAELSAARQASGMQHVELDPATCRVRFRRPGIVLNPGSIGKGWALDAAAQALARQGCSSALLQGGCSSVLALGTPPGSPTGWCVGLADPRVPVRRQARLWLKDQALATSAATFKQASVGGRAINHILDPRIGLPASGLLAATALAPTAAQADALATAFFVLAPQESAAVCAALPGVGALLIGTDGSEPIRLGVARELTMVWGEADAT